MKTENSDKGKIIIIDDNRDLAENIEDILAGKGFAIGKAYTGKSAIDKFRNVKYDLALVDIKLPDTDGLELIEKINKISPATVYLVITGYESLTSAMRSVKIAQVISYETKPLDFNNIIPLISQTLDKKKLEEKLQESQDRLKLIAQVSTDLIYEWDIQTDTLEWFGNVDEYLGYNPGEIPRTIEGWIQLIHPDDQKKLSNSVERHRTSTESIEENYRVHKKDGTWVFWSDIGSPILDNNNKPVKWIGGCEDITERKLAEEALEENEERYRQIYQFSPDSIIIHDMDMNILDANNKAVEEFGYSKLELLKMKVFELHPEDELKHSKHVLAEMKKVSALNVETKFLRKDGSIFLAEATPCKYTLGSKPIIHVVIRDITERKKAQEALEESEVRYRNLFENSSEFLFTLDLKGNFTDVNKAAVTITGFTKSELLKKNFKDYIPKKDHRKLLIAFSKMYKTGEPQQDLPIEAIMKDGSIKYFETSFSLLKKEGQIIGLQGSSKDITERKQAEEALKESEAKYRRVSDNSPAILYQFMMAPDGGFSFPYLSDMVETIFGVCAEDVIKAPSKLLDFVHPDDKEIFHREIMR
ncbi:MAG: PAS domain S-box protein, partial [Deltaproteobacteria bacterium]|nr:PAS domain S-box protein [Candidatus Desulfobacula maris]